MIEILAVAGLCGAIGKMMRDKGRIALGYQTLVVVFWLGGKFLAAAMAISVGGIRQLGWELSVTELIGAVLGVGLAYTIASLVPPRTRFEEQSAWKEAVPVSDNPYNAYQSQE